MTTAIFMMSEHNPVGEEYLSAIIHNKSLELQCVIVEVSEFSKRCELYNNQRMGGLYRAPDISETLDGTHIPVLLVKKHKSEYTKTLLKMFSPDIVVAGGVGGILKNDILTIPKIGFIGCHPGLLPDVRGSNVIANAVVDDKLVGATCFFMDEGVDTGDIIYKREMNIYCGDTYEMLEARMLKHAGEVLSYGIRAYCAGNIRPTKQHEGHEYKADERVVQKAKQKLLNRKYEHYVV